MNERIRELIQMADLCAAGLMASGATEEEIQTRSKVVLAELVRADEREVIFNLLVDCSGRDGMSDSDESLLAYLAGLLKERDEK
jgi:hypothetical protein